MDTWSLALLRDGKMDKVVGSAEGTYAQCIEKGRQEDNFVSSTDAYFLAHNSDFPYVICNYIWHMDSFFYCLFTYKYSTFSF